MLDSVLVTGGAGFIGSNIVERLLSLRSTVTVVDDLSSGRYENIASFLKNPEFQFVKGTITDLDLLVELIKKRQITFICHQAAVPSVVKSIEEPDYTADVNIKGTIYVLQAALEGRCKKVVIASSCAVYGDSPELPKRESMPYSPKSPYAITKVANEMYARVYREIHGLDITCLRYFNVYGKRQSPHSDYAAVIPKFINLALKEAPLTIYGDGLQTRDFVYIEDVVEANLLALNLKQTKMESFNVASGKNINLIELAGMILKLTKSNSEIKHLAPVPGDIRDSLADISFTGKKLKFKPSYTLEKGLYETVKWFTQ